MTWTYTEDPASSEVDEVRFLVGDTDDAEELVQDEEIEYQLVMWPKPAGKPAWLAAAAVCDAIAGQFARRAQRAIGSLSIAAQQQWEHYVHLADQYREMYLTDGLGTAEGGSPHSFASIRAGIPVLGGGGPSVLGGPNILPAGGTGVGG
jgi:hypothetical protein